MCDGSGHQRTLRHLRCGWHTMRRRPQHGSCPLWHICWPSVPRPAVIGQLKALHWSGDYWRLCRFSPAGCVLQGHGMRCRPHFDQSPRGNHLDLAPPGGAVRKPDRGVNATRERLRVGGHSVYGAYFEGGMGYRNDRTRGIATGDEPESMYMVAAGRHYNRACCFDYGNAETDAIDHGAGTMEAVYFGAIQNREGAGAGHDGPWVQADLENGLWAGSTARNPSNSPIVADFVTAMVKGRAGGFTLKGGDAQQGPLKKLYEGARPARYGTMRKQGAIILGIGGDNSNWGVGTFYEGVMASGFSSDAADDAVQANIVAAGYGHDAMRLV
mmetsp:Transcript_93628/g.260658  ORF Transcript_93628/g.260658 Transcript_93628/m.260658 type:complete len:327 (-) Transcript_93628:24-1004(-)